MKSRVAIFFGLGALRPRVRRSGAETDEEVEAHKLVLDLTGAFSNDGFKLRDGHWTGTIKPQERALIAVNLYAGNQYWFSAAAEREGQEDLRGGLRRKRKADGDRNL